MEVSKLPEIILRPASATDLDQCLALEQSVAEFQRDAATLGFLLSGDSRRNYEEYLESGPFILAEKGNEVVGFVFGLAPDSKRLQQLKSFRHRFQISDPTLLDQSDFAWLAKVAVSIPEMRKGIATQLYRKLLEDHPTWCFMTTTVLAPIRNVPSEHLHQKFGFANVGTLALGSRGELENIVCAVHYRPGESSR